jgi:hypothetical protein
MIVTGMTSTAGAAAAGIRQSFTSTGHLHLAIRLGSVIHPGRTVRVWTGESSQPVAGRLVVPHRGEPARSGPSGGEARSDAPGSSDPRRFLRREARAPAGEIRWSVHASGPIDRERVPGVVGRHRHELVTRLVHGIRRIEVAPRPAPFVQDRAFVPGEADRAAAAPRPRDTTRTGGSAGAVRSAATGTAASVDLDQLTDQVVTRLDARLIAHRERFGRGI